MLKIALIQDGTEVARQSHADVRACFDCVCEEAPYQAGRWSLEVFTDTAVKYLLEGLSNHDYDAVVLASNALLSSAVRDALDKGRGQLHSYLDHGGGLVLLHQLVDSVDWLIPQLPDDAHVDRDTVAAPEGAQARLEDRGDVLLRYPVSVEENSLRDGGQYDGPRRLYWKAFLTASLIGDFKPVLTSGEHHTLLARTHAEYPAGRVVLSTIPADWHHRVELLRNCISFAAQGEPDRVVWRRGEAQQPLLESEVSRGGSTAFGQLPAFDRPNLLESDRWLLEHVRFCILPEWAALQHLASLPIGQSFIRRGGALVALQVAQDNAVELQAVVGGQRERTLVSRLYLELDAVDGWDSVAYAFELRNIVSALRLFWTEHGGSNSIALDPRRLGAVRNAVERHLVDPAHQEDFGSSVALGQCLAYIDGNDSRLEATCWMTPGKAPNWDVALQASTFGVLRGDVTFDVWCQSANTEMASRDPSLASTVRVLDALAFLAALCERAPSQEHVRSLAIRVDRILSGYPPRRSVGWLSYEATADIARGLAVMLRILGPESRDDPLYGTLTRHLAASANILVEGLDRYQRNRKGVAWLARLTEAMAVIERQTPVAFEHLADLISPASLDKRVARADQSVAEDLARANVRLRAESQVLRREQAPAALGRLTANVTASGLFVAALIIAIQLLRNDTPGTAIAALGVVTIGLAGLVVLLSGLLARFNLLYSWAETPYGRAKIAVVKKLGFD
jgi:hypothetical protein